jgi:hypothetical protein
VAGENAPQNRGGCERRFLRYDRSNYNAGFLSSIFFVVGSRGSPFSVTSLSQPSTTADPRTRGSVRRASGFVQIARTLVDRGSERYGPDCFNAEKPAVPKSFGGTLADGFQRCLPQPRVTLSRCCPSLALEAGGALPANAAHDIGARGLNFHPDAEFLTQVKKAGADATVVAALIGAKVTATADTQAEKELLGQLASAAVLM